MTVARFLLVLIISYAVSACGISNSGSGAEAYSDTGTFESSVDENGNAVPLTLISSESGVVTASSSTTGRTYTFNTVDENGNPVSGIILTFTEQSAEAAFSINETEELPENALIGIVGAENTNTGTSAPYAGKVVTVVAMDPSGRYGATVAVFNIDDSASASSDVRMARADNIQGRPGGAGAAGAGMANSAAGTAGAGISMGGITASLFQYTWPGAKKSTEVAKVLDGVTDDNLREAVSLNYIAAKQKYAQDHYGDYDSTGLYSNHVSVLAFKRAGEDEFLDIVEVPKSATLTEVFDNLKSLAADVYGGNAEDYTDKVFRYYRTSAYAGVHTLTNGYYIDLHVISLDDNEEEEVNFSEDFPYEYIYASRYMSDGYGNSLLYLKYSEAIDLDDFYFETVESNSYLSTGVLYGDRYFASYATLGNMTTGVYNNYKVYGVRGGHVFLIDKPVYAFSGTLLSFTNNNDSAMTYLSWDGYRHNQSITGTDLIDNSRSIDYNVTHVHDLPLTVSISSVLYNKKYGGTITGTVVDAADYENWFEFDNSAGTFSITVPEDVQAKKVTMYATFTEGLFSTSVRISVDITDTVPVIPETIDLSVDAGEAFSYIPDVTNGDGDILTFTISKDIPWAEFNTSTGAITGTPSVADVGTVSDIVITVTDGTTELELDPFSITVEGFSITGTPSVSAVVGSSYSFTPVVSGSSGTLTYSITNKPSWASFNTSTGALTGTPTGAAATYGSITISVTDGTNTAALATFSIDVPNTAPEISGTPSLSVYYDDAYDFVPTASDANGDALTFSILNKPGWATFNTSTGALSGIPSSADIGVTSSITIRVADGTETVSLTAFNLSVTNAPPEISGSPAATANVGTAYSFTPVATDANDAAADLTFSIENKPSWASFDTSTGALAGTPSSTGTFADIVISVTDGTDSDSLDAFSITVSGASVAQNFIVLKTGQTTVYATNDDGTYQKGTTKSLSRDAVNEIVTDAVTGLIWQDVADNAADTYSWADAGTYCDGLSHAGYDDWRLPTMLEFTTIINYGTSGNALDSTFVNTSPLFYWSSTEAVNISTVFAYTIDMDLGADLEANKNDLNFARCVR